MRSTQLIIFCFRSSLRQLQARQAGLEKRMSRLRMMMNEHLNSIYSNALAESGHSLGSTKKTSGLALEIELLSEKSPLKFDPLATFSRQFLDFTLK